MAISSGDVRQGAEVVGAEDILLDANGGVALGGVGITLGRGDDFQCTGDDVGAAFGDRNNGRAGQLSNGIGQLSGIHHSTRTGGAVGDRTGIGQLHHTVGIASGGLDFNDRVARGGADAQGTIAVGIGGDGLYTTSRGSQAFNDAVGGPSRSAVTATVLLRVWPHQRLLPDGPQHQRCLRRHHQFQRRWWCGPGGCSGSG